MIKEISYSKKKRILETRRQHLPAILKNKRQPTAANHWLCTDEQMSSRAHLDFKYRQSLALKNRKPSNTGTRAKNWSTRHLFQIIK